MLLELQMPGNVVLVINKISEIASFTIFPVNDFLEWLFNFSPTDPIGVGFECSGIDSASVTKYLGMGFVMMNVMGLQYLAFGLASGCRKYSPLMAKIRAYLAPGCVYGLLYVFLKNTYLDWAIGSALRLEQPKYDTPSDRFDLVLGGAGVLAIFVFPVFNHFFLRKNVKRLGDEEF